jgi:glycosyltransferase involved in cell wall biosynthesis
LVFYGLLDQRGKQFEFMKVSVITPSYSQSEWLRLCVASVADQGGDVEHIVQDAGSRDGTREWLTEDARVRAFVESDKGMYDAVNRGLRRAQGDVLAYLNCDEQYLPGALGRVVDFFETNPSVDVLFGDVVAVDSRCEYLFHRKMLTPLKWHTWLCQLSTLTCGMFFRRRVIDEWEIFFDENLRYVGDAEWILRLLERGARMATLGSFTSVFGCTGENLSHHEGAQTEMARGVRSPPAWVKLCRPAIVAHHRLRRLFGGAYSRVPFNFELYPMGQPERRVRRVVDRPTFRWDARTEAAR